MSPAFKKVAEENFPGASIVFDRFHLAKMLNEAPDYARKSEVTSQPILKSSRMALLKKEKNLTIAQKEKLETIKLKDTELKTARAWRMRNTFGEIYKAQGQEEFEQLLKEWIGWAGRSKIEPMKEFGKTVKDHWEGIVNWMKFKVSNGILEGLNSIFQAAKARGYKTMDTAKTMIYLLT